MVSAYTEISVEKPESGEVPTVLLRLDQAGFIRIKRSQALEEPVQLLFLGFSFRLYPFKIAFYKDQLRMELEVSVGENGQTLRVSLEDYWEREGNHVEHYRLFDQEQNRLEPLLAPFAHPGQKQRITRFILRAKVSSLAQHAFITRYYQKHLRAPQQILTVLEQGERIKLIGSSGADILRLSESVDFAYGGAGPDLYVLKPAANSSNLFRQVIHNGASDRALDLLVLPSTRDQIRLKASRKSLVIKDRALVQAVTIKNYFKNRRYQHLTFLDADRLLWMILKDEKGVQAIPYDQASLRHRPLVVQLNTVKKHPQRAVDVYFHRLQYVRECNDLLLMDRSETLFFSQEANRFRLRLKDYYTDPSLWRNLTLLETRNGCFTQTSTGAYRVLTGSMLREYARLAIQREGLHSKESAFVTAPNEHRKQLIQGLLVACQAERLTPDQVQDLQYGLALARQEEAPWASDFYKSLDFSNKIEFATFIEAYRKQHTEAVILRRLTALFSDKQATKTTEYLSYQLAKLFFQGMSEAEIIRCFPLIPGIEIRHFLDRIPEDKGDRTPKHFIAAVEKVIKNQRLRMYTAIQRQQTRLSVRYYSGKQGEAKPTTERSWVFLQRTESEAVSFLKGTPSFFTAVNQLKARPTPLINAISSTSFFPTTSLTYTFFSALHLVRLFLVKRKSGCYPFLSNFKSLTQREAASLSVFLWEEIESFFKDKGIGLDVGWWDIQALQAQWRERLYQSNFVGVLERLEDFLTVHLSVCSDYSPEMQKVLLDHILRTLTRFRGNTALCDMAQVVTDEAKTYSQIQHFF